MKKYKVRCTGYKTAERYFTVGKVYDVVDGRITNDNGFTYGESSMPWLSEQYYDFVLAEDYNHKIVITTDGKTTLARLYDGKTVIKSAGAKCSPDDTFDFAVGAKLAMERLNAPEEKFVPHLRNCGDYYGDIGEETNYKDAIGRPLRIGDTIELYNDELCYRGEEAIVRSDGKTFVMGIEMACDEATGSTSEWKIIKKRSFDEVAHGEKVGDITYIKTE